METPLSRTNLLREIRKMRFEEVYGGWQERRLTQEEAARVLGMSERNFRRQLGRYEADGLDGLDRPADRTDIEPTSAGGRGDACGKPVSKPA